MSQNIRKNESLAPGAAAGTCPSPLFLLSFFTALLSFSFSPLCVRSFFLFLPLSSLSLHVLTFPYTPPFWVLYVCMVIGPFAACAGTLITLLTLLTLKTLITRHTHALCFAFRHVLLINFELMWKFGLKDLAKCCKKNKRVKEDCKKFHDCDTFFELVFMGMCNVPMYKTKRQGNSPCVMSCRFLPVCAASVWSATRGTGAVRHVEWLLGFPEHRHRL